MPHTPDLDLPMDVADVLAAMRQLGSYLDVAPDQALDLYRLAYAHAVARLAQDIPVAAIMTPDVTTAAPGATARDATLAMARAGVSGLPVVDGGAVVGVLSIKDVLRLLGLPLQSGPAALAARLLDPETCLHEIDQAALGRTPVARLMTSPAVTVTPDTPRSDAARLKAARRINRLPVVDKGVLYGIVSRADVVRSCRGLECPL